MNQDRGFIKQKELRWFVTIFTETAILKLQMPGPFLDILNQKFWKWGSAFSGLTRPLGDSHSRYISRTAGLSSPECLDQAQFLITISGNGGKGRPELARILEIQGSPHNMFAYLKEVCVLLSYLPSVS